MCACLHSDCCSSGHWLRVLDVTGIWLDLDFCRNSRTLETVFEKLGQRPRKVFC
jgi:hypothetical protein